MKTFLFVAAAILATAVDATPDHVETVELEATIVCTDPPASTVTVTESCAPAQTAVSAPGAPINSVVTVTVTSTAPPVTITQTIGVGGSGTGSGSGSGETTILTTTTTASTTTLTSTTSATRAAETFHVDVGTFNGKVQFVPDQLNAEIGDIVLYNFLAKSHSLTQSNFSTPCTANGEFDTGLNQPNPKNISGLFVIPFEVKTKSPQWFYCKQPGPPNHCGLGMVFGLNPAGKMDQFIKNAIAQNGNLTSTSTSGPTPPPTTTSSGSVTTVTVGLMNGTVLKFDPPYVQNVQAGEKIHFDFRAANHTLTESTFDQPCTKLDGTDTDTNFMNVNKADIDEFAPFDFTATSDKPRFFYCKQANGTPKSHCGKGMVFGINIDEATFDQYEKNAEATLPAAPPAKRAAVMAKIPVRRRTKVVSS
ncbi:hypothetical protein MMC09_001013 [Bachmanniomyces sp. S44760]|nr:hypothetical protein [Bachmanniomyces sp. S44760]